MSPADARRLDAALDPDAAARAEAEREHGTTTEHAEALLRAPQPPAPNPAIAKVQRILEGGE